MEIARWHSLTTTSEVVRLWVCRDYRRKLCDTRRVSTELSAIIGLVFGVLAAACAFFISYHEYKNNWNFRGSAGAMALRSALVTFVFFFVAALALGVAFRLIA
jgi:hypothetical protein